MKKIIFTVLITLILFLSACSGTSSATENVAPAESNTVVTDSVSQDSTAPTSSSATGTTELITTYENAVPIGMQLLLGTIKLEGTDLAVTTGQASLLIPLWTNFKTISESMRPPQGGPNQGQPNSTPQPPTVNTGLQEQLDTIIEKIQAVMTVEQITAISAMQITRETAQTIMQEKGITMSGPQQGDGNGPSGGQPPQGNMPQGTPPAGGPGGSPPGMSQMGTPPADGMQPRVGFMPLELIDALIQLLEQKAGS